MRRRTRGRRNSSCLFDHSSRRFRPARQTGGSDSDDDCANVLDACGARSRAQSPERRLDSEFECRWRNIRANGTAQQSYRARLWHPAIRRPNESI